MKEILCNSAYFGVTVSLIGYGAGIMLKKKFKYAFLNPLLISIIFVIGVVMLCGVDYESYENSAQYLSYLLTPATVCLAVPLYQQMTLLKKNLAAVACGILAGVLASLGSVLLLAFLFGLEHDVYVTLLPKSITTAIGMGVSEELGGLVTITVAVIIVTGVIGNVIGEAVCKLFRIYEPIAKWTGTWHILPCDRDGQSTGNGRSGRCDEQPGDRGSRSSDCDRSLCICWILLKI